MQEPREPVRVYAGELGERHRERVAEDQRVAPDRADDPGGDPEGGERAAGAGDDERTGALAEQGVLAVEI